ncbi:toxin-antitoxin system YwqK family antitoxin [Candidatus Seribacter sulfatis]|uniref:toxin-antitoxin system YwqK family antitoxin n=1 Tax=Candidatus Seribacter sulfatis TaxID=3381756 RepID=UPI00389AE717
MMNKIIFPFLASLLVCLFSSCIQTSPSSKGNPSRDKTVMLHWLDLDDQGIVRLTGNDGNVSKSSNPFTGEAIETFEQSPTKSVSEWKEGKKHGTTTEYFYNGRKRRIINYKNGIKHGIAEEYRITGELLRRETYQEGNLNGPKSEWHPNGAKILEVQMRNAKPHGEALEWYPDGLEKSSTIYRHGLREGPSSEWYTNGQRKLGLFYQKDKQHGQRTIWYEDGQKRLTAQFEEDMMEGNSQGWFPGGQQQFDYNFRKNLEHGVCTEWNSEGKKISEIRFVDGSPSQNLLTGEKIITPAAEKEDPSSSSIPSTENATPLLNPSANPTNEGVFAPPSLNNDTRNSQNTISKELPTNPTPETEKETLVPPPPTIPINPVSNDIAVPQAEPSSAPPLTAPTVPGFNPFEDEPSKPKVNPIEQQPIEVIPTPPLPPPPPPSFDPFEDKPLVPNQSALPPPPPPPSFNPFEDNLSPSSETPVLEETTPPPPPPPPGNINPFNNPSTSPAPDAKGTPFDPFATEDEATQGKDSDVPLGDVFNTPPQASPTESGFDNIPPPPPPPPTFNPFDLPPLPGE